MFNYEKSRIENYKQCLKYEKYFSNGNLDKYKLFIINTIPDFQKKDSNICIRFVCEKKSKSSYYPNQYSVYLESIQNIIAIPAEASKEAINTAEAQEAKKTKKEEKKQEETQAVVQPATTGEQPAPTTQSAAQEQPKQAKTIKPRETKTRDEE